MTIIGNLVRDPESRSTPNGHSVCNFVVAVNNRQQKDENGQPKADFFRISAWDKLGESCQKYLNKGRKVCVIGPVSARVFQAQDGTSKASLEVRADDVEFLSSGSNEQSSSAPAMTPVNVDGELPF